jgi:hypothetical protein
MDEMGGVMVEDYQVQVIGSKSARGTPSNLQSVLCGLEQKRCCSLYSQRLRTVISVPQCGG